jgi:hypothetical protein
MAQVPKEFGDPKKYRKQCLHLYYIRGELVSGSKKKYFYCFCVFLA